MQETYIPTLCEIPQFVFCRDQKGSQDCGLHKQ